MVRAEADLVRSIDNGGGRDPQGATGTVFLVGAGPGDPDLLTLRALQVLQDADIVFHDELVTDAVLDRVRRDAKRVFVGKRRGEPGIGQDEINRRLVDAAQAGRKVVRSKGGDAFVFGRGGEEIERLREQNIPIVIVPGITAALGCAAEAELPLTFRNEATRLSFVTAHRADEAAAVDWSGLSGKETTVVVYMGLASAAAVRDGLIKAGRDPATPAAVLARGTRPDFARRGRPSRRSSQARRLCRRRPGAAGDRRGRRALEAVARNPRIPECTGGRMTSPHEQKKRKVNGSVVVTANRLGDGAVVYRTVNDELDDRSRVGRGGGGAGRGRAAATRGSRRRACGRPLYRAGRAGAGQPRAAGQSARAHPACRPDLHAAGRGGLRFKRCTATTISTRRWSTSASRNSATRWAAGSPAR